MDDGRRSYTAMFLPGEVPRIFPTSDREHARILEIFKQDKRHQDVLNDFTDYDLGGPVAREVRPPVRPNAGKRKPVARRRRSS